ncbi:unnamed protein product [Heligmosomoides polygyrus]|uniref:SCP domain-containing protein n=1 Tax=Heligmosomoides polygyrus TaxID=6339 RepID=A0A183GF13_HELPZ|nr:unnamed protein product [Heligmosomoides polygyrus]
MRRSCHVGRSPHVGRRPLICTLKIATSRLKKVERCGAPRIKWWRVRVKEAAVISRVRLPTVTTVDETWKKATDAIRQAAQSELGITNLDDAMSTSRYGCGQTTWKQNCKGRSRFITSHWQKYQEAKKASKEDHGCCKSHSLWRCQREARITRWWAVSVPTF